jgi:hypothetical protein
MMPEDILQKYKNFNNPYRKLIEDGAFYIACDYSDQISSWMIESISGPRYPLYLFKSAIKNSENRNYYSFYMVVDYKNFELHQAQMQIVDVRYQLTVEEFVPANAKSINMLFWDWLLDSKSTDTDRVIVLHTLPQKYRDDI